MSYQGNWFKINNDPSLLTLTQVLDRIDEINELKVLNSLGEEICPKKALGKEKRGLFLSYTTESNKINALYRKLFAVKL